MTRDPLPLPAFSFREIVAVAAAVVLALLMLGGCATFGSPTPLKAWSVALTTYTSAARTMAAWCSSPSADEDACRSAAGVSAQTDLVILATEAKLRDPNATVSDAELAAATASLNAALPLLQHAAGGK